MNELIIISAAAMARYAQANGYGGPGRWSLLGVMLVGAFVGPMQGIFELKMAIVVGIMAVCLWGTTAFGYTDWANWKYSLLRYTVPVIIGVLPYIVLTQSPSTALLLLIGPVLAADYYFLAQHKPDWLGNIVGNRDVASVVAGAAVGCMVLV